MELYRAVVENNNDPLKIGRVQVRIHGMHSEENENSDIDSTVSTGALPWAELMGSTEFGLISGVGISSILRKGTWVWVILDHDDPNKPIVMGTIIGKTSEKTDYTSGKGFCDPDGVYPKTDRVGRSDMHPLLDDKYLTIATLETESGHLIELDDTPGDERIKVTHRTGTFIEIDKDGTMHINVVKDLNMNVTGNSTWNTVGNTVITAARIDLN